MEVDQTGNAGELRPVAEHLAGRGDQAGDEETLLKLGSFGDLESAGNVFRCIVDKDDVMWNSMIFGSLKNHRIGDALRIFSEMLASGVSATQFTYSIVLNACAKLEHHAYVGSLMAKQSSLAPPLICLWRMPCLTSAIFATGTFLVNDCGKALHGQVIKAGFESSFYVRTMLISVYFTNGENGSQTRRDDTLLGGKTGYDVDMAVYGSLVDICLVNEGKNLWNCMRSFNLRPGPKHYSCMVSLLSQAGLLEEAEEMINKAPFYDDHFELWRTLLSSSINYQNLRMGIRATEHVLSLDVEDTTTHILLFNLYAAAGKWDVVAETR
ncbi:pentatricopeptide repeat-containing protein At3g50420-like [Eucalyptus grandis]|uniref:pentatricopeptide repeat-containing protein At3g50420-like n=1 Tax=Eucalyptus grandis TaxID=71139 RepID=UPI00192ED33E|nr:pentatricopeptide repeat-containing protein At3g50420-like [Eucalyptus grandis]